MSLGRGFGQLWAGNAAGNLSDGLVFVAGQPRTAPPLELRAPVGWYYGIPLIAMTLSLLAATMLALWRISAAPRPTLESLGEADRLLRVFSARAVMKLSSGALSLWSDGTDVAAWPNSKQKCQQSLADSRARALPTMVMREPLQKARVAGVARAA